MPSTISHSIARNLGHAIVGSLSARLRNLWKNIGFACGHTKSLTLVVWITAIDVPFVKVVLKVYSVVMNISMEDVSMFLVVTSWLRMRFAAHSRIRSRILPNQMIHRGSCTLDVKHFVFFFLCIWWIQQSIYIISCRKYFFLSIRSVLITLVLNSPIPLNSFPYGPSMPKVNLPSPPRHPRHLQTAQRERDEDVGDL